MKLTTVEAAELLGVTKQTIRKWCKTGNLKSKWTGKKYLINKKDLEIFVKETEQAKKSKREAEALPYMDKNWLLTQLKTKTVKEIALACYVSKETIYSWCYKNEISIKNLKPPAKCFGDPAQGFKNKRVKGFHRVAKL